MVQMNHMVACTRQHRGTSLILHTPLLLVTSWVKFCWFQPGYERSRSFEILHPCSPPHNNVAWPPFCHMPLPTTTQPSSLCVRSVQHKIYGNVGSDQVGSHQDCRQTRSITKEGEGRSQDVAPFVSTKRQRSILCQNEIAL